MKTMLVLAASGLMACCPPARADRLDCSIFRNFQAQFACYDNLSRGPEKEMHRPPVAKPQTSSARQRKHKAD